MKIADYIEQNEERIVAQYVQTVSVFKSAEGLVYDELVDTLPEYLHTLAAISRAGRQVEPEKTRARLEFLHLSLRMRCGFRLDEVVFEYRLLRNIFYSLWQDRPKEQQPHDDDVKLIDEELTAAMRHVEVVFQGYSADDRQDERHYVARLTRLADRGFSANRETSWKLLLPDMLEIAQDALRGEGAALYVVEGQRLVLAGAVAAAPDDLKEIARSDDNVLNLALQREEPVFVDSKHDPDCPFVRNSALRAILAVPLIVRGKHIGALYVGSSGWLPSDRAAMRKIEALAYELGAIIERAQLWNECQQAYDLLDRVIQQSGDGIVVANADGQILIFNEQAQRQHGVPMQNVPPYDWPRAYGLLDQDDRPLPASQVPLYQALQGLPVRDARWKVRRPDGAIRLMVGSATPLFGAQGERIGAVLTIRDDTERVAAEVERERSAEQAERLALAREQVLAAVSHDLRDPLGVMLTSSALLHKMIGPEQAEAKRHIDIFVRSGERMVRLIDDLGDLAAIQAGHLRLRPAFQDLVAVLRELHGDLAPVAAAAKVRLELHVGPASLSLFCDKDRLAQALSNLVSNAIKASHPEGIVQLACSVKDGLVFLTVRDEGRGIAADALPHLFDRYWRGGESEYKGKGLGLAIAKGIIEGHGGQLNVVSELGRGATFTIALPLSGRQ